MDVRTGIKGRLPSRHLMVGGSTNAALRQPAIAGEYGIEFAAAQIFKKTPCVSDLKPRGRYVAKDMGEVAGIPLVMKTLLGKGYLHGDCLTVSSRTIAENLKSARENPYRDVVRSADMPITAAGAIALPRDADVGTLNVKLTDVELAERKTKWKPRATNHASGVLWKYAQQVGPAVDGAVTHPGGAHEKQCYADI